MKYKNLLSWILRTIIALILLQTLFFKFTGAAESIYIFETIGLEPIGRYSSGIVELIASILILLPKTKTWGALLAFGTMTGALFFHLTTLGIEVLGDGGLLFSMAVFTFLSSIVTLVLHKSELPIITSKRFKSIFSIELETAK